MNNDCDRSITRIAQLAIISIFGTLHGCSGGGGGAPPVDNRPNQPPPAPPTQSGVFKDINVSGLDFESGAESGTTGSDGSYTCETGSDVSFSVGAVPLGSALCSSLLSPPSLVASGEFDDPEAINIARFLQLVDTDGDAANGLTISSGLQQVADSWPAIDFAAADLASQLTTVISDIQSVDGRTVSAPPTAAEAFEHMDTVLSCAYGGTFVGSLSGSNSGAVAFVLGRRLFGFSPDEFLFMAYDPNEEFQLSTSGPYDLSAQSSIDTSAFDSIVIIDASFTDPDTLSGTWNFPPENRSGTLTASRLGSDSGVVRFSGDFAATESRGVLSLVFEESGEVSGTAFDVADGTQFSVSAPAPQSSLFDLTITGGGETIVANASLSIDANGILRMDGSWDDGTQFGGQFSAVGCTLNPLP